MAVTEPSEGDSGTVEPVLAEDLSDPQAFFTSELSDFEMDSPVQTNRSIQSYWKDVVREVKEWSVGEKAEWGEYWDRGLGKSTINLAIQYHSGGEVGFDAQAALSPALHGHKPAGTRTSGAQPLTRLTQPLGCRAARAAIRWPNFMR